LIDPYVVTGVFRLDENTLPNISDMKFGGVVNKESRQSIGLRLMGK